MKEPIKRVTGTLCAVVVFGVAGVQGDRASGVGFGVLVQRTALVAIFGTVAQVDEHPCQLPVSRVGVRLLLERLFGRQPWLSRILAGTGTKSVALAALFGAPLPLCSCSVLPAGLTLRREGARREPRPPS